MALATGAAVAVSTVLLLLLQGYQQASQITYASIIFPPEANRFSFCLCPAKKKQRSIGSSMETKSGGEGLLLGHIH